MKEIIIAGLAMFSMFFGSGNLVFPLMVGTETTVQAFPAVIGIFFGAVFVPLLGLIALALCQGNYHEFFDKLGKWSSSILIGSILFLIGPFGIIPRCITVAYGGALAIVPNLPDYVFSALFCGVIFYLLRTPNQIVDVIGKVLTPFKMGGIALLIIVGLWFSHTPHAAATVSAETAFWSGLLEGYQTMDLLGAFFFSGTVVSYLQKNAASKGKNSLLRLTIGASLVGALALALAYVGLIYLGARYSNELTGLEPILMLPQVAHLSMGSLASPILGGTLVISCLATATILASVFSDYFKKDIVNNHLTLKNSLILTLVVSFVFSLLGFAKIRVILGTFLTILYPALIAYTAATILSKLSRYHYQKHCFWGVLSLTIIYKVINSLSVV